MNKQKIKVRIIENSFLARIATWKLGSENVAMVLGNYILLYNVSRQHFLQSNTWVCHELVHVQQWHRHTYLGFLAKYLWYSIRYGYTNNPFEVEASKLENDVAILSLFDIK